MKNTTLEQILKYSDKTGINASDIVMDYLIMEDYNYRHKDIMRYLENKYKIIGD